MSSKIAYDEVLAKLTATVGATWPILPWDELDPTLEQSLTPFLSIADTASEEVNVSIGSPTENWLRESGVIDIHIFVPPSEAFPEARDIAEQIRDAMRMQQLSNQVNIKIVSPPEPGIIADGLWTSMIVGIEFQRTYTAATA